MNKLLLFLAAGLALAATSMLAADPAAEFGLGAIALDWHFAAAAGAAIPAWQQHDLIRFAKGEIDAGALASGGTLKPQQSNRILSLVAKNPFLSGITRRTMTRLKADGYVIDIAQRSLRSVPEGQEPAEDDKTGITNFPYQLYAQAAELFTDVTRSFIQDNLDNPQFLTELEAAFATRIADELVDLGFNGDESVAQDHKDYKFLKLNNGWLKIAANSNDTNKITIDPETDGWVDTLANIIKMQDSRFVAGSSLIMNTVDAVEYDVEVGKHVTGRAAIADSKANGLVGFNIIRQGHMPAKTVMFSPPKNLIYGINKNITRHKAWHARKRVVEYTWELMADFEIAAKQAVVLATPA